MKEKEYSVTEAAELLQVSRQAVLIWVQDGKIPARRKGLGKTSPYLIKQSDLQETIEALGLEVDLQQHRAA